MSTDHHGSKFIQTLILFCMSPATFSCIRLFKMISSQDNQDWYSLPIIPLKYTLDTSLAKKLFSLWVLDSKQIIWPTPVLKPRN